MCERRTETNIERQRGRDRERATERERDRERETERRISFFFGYLFEQEFCTRKKNYTTKK